MAGVTVGEAQIKLSYDGASLDAKSGKALGTAFGNSWSVAAGDLIASGAKKALAVVIDLGKEIIETGMEFEKQMSKVSAIGQIYGSELENVARYALDTAATSVYTGKEAGQALEYMALAGWNAQQMTAGLPGILNLAAAAQADLGTTSDIVTDAITAFGYSAKDSAKFADILAQTMANSNTTVELLGESFKYVGPVAGSLKYRLEDVAWALGTMASSGIKGSQAGTSLRMALSRLISPTKNGQKAMEKFGISLFDANGNARDFKSIMIDLRKVFGQTQFDVKKLSEAAEAGDEAWKKYAKTLPTNQQEKLQALTEMFTVRSMPAMLSIIEASAEDFELLGDKIYHAEGAAQTMADTMLNNLAGRITLVKSALDTAMNYLFYFDDYDKFFEYVGSAMSQAVDIIINAAPRIHKAVLTILDRLTEVLPDAIPKVLDFVIGIVDGLAEDIPKILKAVVGLLDGIVKWMGNPENIGKVKDAVLKLLDGVADLIPELVKLLVNDFPKVVTAITKTLSDPKTLIEIGKVSWKIVAAFFTGLGEALSQMWDELKEHWAKRVDEIVGVTQKVAEKISSVFTVAREKVEEVFGAIGAWFADRWEDIKNGLRPIATWIGETWQKIWRKIVEIFTPVGEWFKARWEDIKAAFAPVVEWAKELAETAWDNIKKVFEGVGRFFVFIWEEIKTAFSPVVEWLGQKFSAAWDAIKEVFGAVGSWFSDRWHDIQEVFSAVGSWFGERFTEAKDEVETAFSPVVEWLGERWEDIKGIFGAVGNWFGERFEEAKEQIKHVFNAIMEFFKSFWETLKTFWKTAVGALAAIVVNTLKSAFNSVLSFIEGVVNGAIWALNKLIDLINIIPGMELSHLPELTLPKLAQGGVADSATPALIGEAGREAVLPLERNTGNWSGLLAETLLNAMEDRDDDFADDNEGYVMINMELDGDILGQALLRRERLAA